MSRKEFRYNRKLAKAWERLVRKIVQSIYRGHEIICDRRLPNLRGRPDNFVKDLGLVVDAKLSAYRPRKIQYASKYHCDPEVKRVEFWCLRKGSNFRFENVTYLFPEQILNLISDETLKKDIEDFILMPDSFLRKFGFWTRRESLTELRKFGETIGRAPTSREVDFQPSDSLPSTATYRKLFGSLTNALLQIGYVPERLKFSKAKAKDILAIFAKGISDYKKQHGEYPTIRQYNQFCRADINRRYPSSRQVLRTCDLNFYSALRVVEILDYPFRNSEIKTERDAIRALTNLEVNLGREIRWKDLIPENGITTSDIIKFGTLSSIKIKSGLVNTYKGQKSFELLEDLRKISLFEVLPPTNCCPVEILNESRKKFGSYPKAAKAAGLIIAKSGYSRTDIIESYRKFVSACGRVPRKSDFNGKNQMPYYLVLKHFPGGLQVLNKESGLGRLKPVNVRDVDSRLLKLLHKHGLNFSRDSLCIGENLTRREVEFFYPSYVEAKTAVCEKCIQVVVALLAGRISVEEITKFFAPDVVDEIS